MRIAIDAKDAADMAVMLYLAVAYVLYGASRPPF